MFYYGVLVFKDGKTKEISAGSEDMLIAKCNIIESASKGNIEKLNIYKMEKVNEIKYQ